MNVKLPARFALALIALAALPGCDQLVGPLGSAKPALLTQHTTSVPALPIVQSAVKSMAPKLDATFDESVIQRVCLLARGEVSQEQIWRSLEQDGLKPGAIPANGHPLSMLVNDDQPGRQLACASYVAASVFTPLDPADYTVRVPGTVGKAKAGATPDGEAVDNQKLMTLLAVKMSIARANAEYFALIAGALERYDGLPMDDYARSVKSMFDAMAPHYLKRVQALYSPSANGYRLLAVNAQGYRFISDGGYAFTLDGGSVRLTYEGMNWLGMGEILGKRYEVKAQLFSSEVAGLAVTRPTQDHR
ncbi:hypothetical protein [Pseudomonas faucium]|uniref:hypothetical protein n=3 Tax=Pseudomonas faucium TaxID=2740518 RepID=UPI001F3A782E|nr:hypothetical protein [Pseudomonas faucium]